MQTETFFIVQVQNGNGSWRDAAGIEFAEYPAARAWFDGYIANSDIRIIECSVRQYRIAAVSENTA